MSKVTIVITVCNDEEFMDRCIESCINQTLNDIEIIIIDDESVDHSFTLAKKYKKIDNRISVIKNKKSGVSVSRNKGLELAKSDWIMFVDGDDWLELDAVEKLYSIVKTKYYDVVIADYFTEKKYNSIEESFLKMSSNCISPNMKMSLIKNCIKKDAFSNFNTSTNIGVPWAKLYNVNFLHKNNCLFQVGLKRMQDMIFNINVFYLSDKIFYLKNPIYHYRIHENSVTKRYTKDFSNTSKEILDALNNFMKKYNLEDSLKEVYNAKVFVLFLEIIKLEVGPNNLLDIKNKIKYISAIKNKEPYKTSISLKINKLLTLKEKILNILVNFHLYFLLIFYYKLKRI